MKLNKLAASCALAVAAMSSQAYAAPTLPLSSAPFQAADVEVMLSGASAPQNILSAIMTQIFEPGYITYYDNGGTVGAYSGKQERAFFGVVKSGAPGIDASLVGKTVRFQDRVRGGSAFGVDPIAVPTPLKNIKATAANCVSVTATTYSCAEVGSDTNAADVNNRVPDFGVSDVEPRMFKSGGANINVEYGRSELASNLVNALSINPTNAVAFGLGVTNSVPNTTHISRNVYGSMLSGAGIQDWSLVNPNITTNPQVVVCRRTPGSGTQATFNQFFNHFPCEFSAGGTTPIARVTDSATYVLNGAWAGAGTAASPYIVDPMDGYTVVENPSSGNVRDCLKAAYNHTDFDITSEDGVHVYRVKFSNSTSPFNAIGVLSMDSAGQESGWSFRWMDGTTNTGTSGDGVAPTHDNIRDGKWDLVSEQTMQYLPATYNTFPALKKTFINNFIARAGAPDVLLAIDAEGVRNSVIALPVGSNDPNDTTTVTNTVKVNGVATAVTATLGSNVAKGTRGGNTCSPTTVLY